jgi:hypothetical protein
MKYQNYLTIHVQFGSFDVLSANTLIEGTKLELLAMPKIKTPRSTIGHVLTTTPTKGGPIGPLYHYGEQK